MDVLDPASPETTFGGAIPRTACHADKATTHHNHTRPGLSRWAVPSSEAESLHHFDHGSCLVLRPAAWRLLLCHLPSQPLCRLRPCRRARAQASSELQPLARPHLPAVRPGGGRKEGRTGEEPPDLRISGRRRHGAAVLVTPSLPGAFCSIPLQSSTAFFTALARRSGAERAWRVELAAPDDCAALILILTAS